MPQHAFVLNIRKELLDPKCDPSTYNDYDTYNDLLEKNITKSYKKAQPETTQAIHKENK